MKVSIQKAAKGYHAVDEDGAILGEVDLASLRKCAREIAAKDGNNEKTGIMEGRERRKVIMRHCESFNDDDLGVVVADYLLEHTELDPTNPEHQKIALSEATRTPEGQRAWHHHLLDEEADMRPFTPEKVTLTAKHNSDELTLATERYMHDNNISDFRVGLSEFTRTPRGQKLWEEHQGGAA
jgi:hypothetical protein